MNIATYAFYWVEKGSRTLAFQFISYSLSYPQIKASCVESWIMVLLCRIWLVTTALWVLNRHWYIDIGKLNITLPRSPWIYVTGLFQQIISHSMRKKYYHYRLKYLTPAKWIIHFIMSDITELLAVIMPPLKE